jgi:hypothetical protein
MKCPKCGHVNPDDAVNCERCRVNLAWAREHLDEYVSEEEKQLLEQQRREELLQEQREEQKRLFQERPNLALWEYTTAIIFPEQVEVTKKSWLTGKETTIVGWDEVESLFGELGIWGWELVAILPKTGSLKITRPGILGTAVGATVTGGVTTTDYFVAVFKRPLPSPSE